MSFFMRLKKSFTLPNTQHFFWGISFFLTSTTSASAATLQEIINNIVEALGSVPTMLSILSFLIGCVLVISGFAYTNKAKNFPQQAEMSTGIWRIVIGVVLITLPTVINAISDLFGTDSTSITRPVF